MYVVIKNQENNEVSYFNMLVSNGTYVTNDLTKAIIFPSIELATACKELLVGLKPDDNFEIAEIVLNKDIQE